MSPQERPDEAEAGLRRRRVQRIAGGLVGSGLVLAGITGAIAAGDASYPSVLRHLYLAPAAWAAIVAGTMGGGLIGLIAGLVQAPVALSGIERSGLSGPGIDGLVAMMMPLGVGLIVGGLVDRSSGRASRLRAALDLQRGLVDGRALDDCLQLAAERVRAAVRADRVGLVVGDGEAPWVVASAPVASSFTETSAAGWTLRTGRSVSVQDLGGDPRLQACTGSGPVPIRGFVVPLGSGPVPVGALAVERAGGLSRATWTAAEEMAPHLTLAVENARLTLRQRHFAEELEEKVTAATERLRELDRAKTEFVSVVAHELRTPLTALQGFTELLLSRTVPPDRQARFLRHLHTEAHRLGRIVAELLDLSRIETGRPLDLRHEAVDVSELLERNVELFVAQHTRHRFEWAAKPTPMPLHADRDAIDRILKNLMSNAVKYSPAGGRIIVTAGPAADRPDLIELSVEDDGVGIPASELPRIFEKYVRIANRETTAVRGLGLGLSLVRALAVAHDGWVEVESLPGKGSIFRVFLPCRHQVLANFPDSSA